MLVAVRRPYVRTVVGLALVALLGAGSLTPVLVTPAAADIAQDIRDGQTQLNLVNDRAERAAEHFNAGRIALVKAKTRAAAARAAADKLTAAVQVLRAQAGGFAVQAYRSGSAASDSLLMLSDTDGPASFLDRASFLESISRRQADVLDQLATARHRQDRATAEAAATLEVAAATVTGLAADKLAVEQAAARAQTLLTDLQAKQAQLIAAAKDAATRQMAIARAAQLARQAALAAAAAAAFAAAGTAPSRVNGPPTQYTGSAVQVALQVAKAQLGKPYVWGADGPDSFDCSGLTMYAYGKAGISLPHYTGDQWNVGRHVTQSELLPGDLIFFHQDLSHMGMYVGNNTFIQAPHSGDVVKYSQLTGYYQDNYAGAVRVVG